MSDQVRHRRRGEELERALLDAAWEELATVGFASLTMESVAARAKTGVAVLYRRWSNKDELVLAAIVNYRETHQVETPDTGTLRGDLLELLGSFSDGQSSFRAVITASFAGLLADSGMTPAEVRGRIIQDAPIKSSAIYRRAGERGEIDLDRIPEAVLSMPFDLMRHELLMTLTAVPAERIVSIVDDLFLPLAAQYRPAVARAGRDLGRRGGAEAVAPFIEWRRRQGRCHPVGMLSASEVESFVADGYVAIRGAVPADVVRACQRMIWSDLGQHGVTEDPATWTEPVVRIACPEGGPFAEAGTRPALWEAFDQLIGAGRWWRRPGVGGTIPVRFPSLADPGDAGWHIEASYQWEGHQQVNVHSRARGLLVLYLFSDVDESSAPTRARPGSHRDAARVLAPAGDEGLAWTDAAAAAAQASARRPTALATGEAGDVFLCHPFLVHAASWPHRGRLPRLMAQPGVALHAQFPLTPPLSPVEQAIINGIGAVGQPRASRVNLRAVSIRPVLD